MACFAICMLFKTLFCKVAIFISQIKPEEVQANLTVGPSFRAVALRFRCSVESHGCDAGMCPA